MLLTYSFTYRTPEASDVQFDNVLNFLGKDGLQCHEQLIPTGTNTEHATKKKDDTAFLEDFASTMDYKILI